MLMMCVIEVSSRRVVEFARRPSARMSTLSSCSLPFESMCGLMYYLRRYTLKRETIDN